MNNENSPEYIRHEVQLTLNPFIFTCGSFLPGQADIFCEALSDPIRKMICRAELLYYRGHAKDAKEISLLLQEETDTDALVGAYLIDIITALSLGNTSDIFDTIDLLKKSRLITDSDPQLKKTMDYFTLFFNILAHDQREITLPDVSTDAFAVPDELKPIAVYAFAHYLIISGDYGRAIGLAEAALIHLNHKYPVSEIYLSLITSIGYICRSEWKKAEYYFMHAWKTALPDRLFMPFAEHKGMLSGLLEKCIRSTYPEENKKISELFASYHKNWVTVHNFLTGDRVTDKLTGTEMNIAMLASKGLSNTEIGDFLSISVNSVRSHMRNIFGKLEITTRKELSEFIIK